MDHFETRLGAMAGKAMVVCMSRQICVDLYREIAALRPMWHGDTDDSGLMKVIMTGSASDPMEWQGHIRNKKRREDMALRFRNPKDPFQLVIVRDMWLTGFDAPSLHTMYVDKPMRGHGLMQAIARVNRVFKDKPGGLVVDYLGLADELKASRPTRKAAAPAKRLWINMRPWRRWLSTMKFVVVCSTAWTGRPGPPARHRPPLRAACGARAYSRSRRREGAPPSSRFRFV